MSRISLLSTAPNRTTGQAMPIFQKMNSERSGTSRASPKQKSFFFFVCDPKTQIISDSFVGLPNQRKLNPKLNPKLTKPSQCRSAGCFDSFQVGRSAAAPGLRVGRAEEGLPQRPGGPAGGGRGLGGAAGATCAAAGLWSAGFQLGGGVRMGSLHLGKLRKRLFLVVN